MKKVYLIIAVIAVISASVFAETGSVKDAVQDGTGFAGAYAPNDRWQPPKDPAAQKKLRKFQDLKFGFFLCWGTQTQLEAIDQSWSLCPERYEWNKRPGVHAGEDTITYKKTYENLIKTFNPVKFDPERIADLAEVAGTKYFVFVTKHHDGFCFWDTKTTDYKITSTNCPYHTNPNANVTKKLFDAFSEKGFWIGAYFSKSDWNIPYYWAPEFGPPTSRNPNYSAKEHPEIWKKFREFTWAQIKELMTDYGSVDILWLDGGQVNPGNGQDIDMPGISAMARKLQPGLLVVDRTVGDGYEDYLTPEGTHAMPKQYRPEVWEACMTLGDWWAWSKDSSYHTSGAIIRYLVRAVARNGNLLLSVGPDANGEVDPKAIKVLKEIGAWLKINGEAIYATRPVKPYELGNVFLTSKADGTVYAIMLSEKDGQAMPKSVIIPSSIARNSKAFTLVGGDGAALTVRPGTVPGTTEIIFPEKVKSPCADAWVIKMLKAPS